jgi:hypothetical protein
MLLLIVGIAVICSLDMLVVAPVLSPENFVLFVEITT